MFFELKTLYMYASNYTDSTQDKLKNLLSGQVIVSDVHVVYRKESFSHYFGFFQ